MMYSFHPSHNASCCYCIHILCLPQYSQDTTFVHGTCFTCQHCLLNIDITAEVCWIGAYSISHNICTQFWLALFCTCDSYCWIHEICTYSSWLPHGHWGKKCSIAGEVAIKDEGKSVCTWLQNKLETKFITLLTCINWILRDNLQWNFNNKSSQWLPNTPFASISECLVS